MTLAAHPDIAPASVKETRYFLPARWGRDLDPRAVYESYWTDAGAAPVRLEATPAYFSGGPALVTKVREVCGEPKIVVVLREPVSRLLSYFTFQQARLRVPETMTLDEYLDRADALTDDDFRDPENEVYFGARGGVYADYLPDWTSEFGADVHVLFFDDLVARPRRDRGRGGNVSRRRPRAARDSGLAARRTARAGYRSGGVQRVALGFNDRFEPFLRRHHGLKRRMRGGLLQGERPSAPGEHESYRTRARCAGPLHRTERPPRRSSSPRWASPPSRPGCPRTPRHDADAHDRN